MAHITFPDVMQRHIAAPEMEAPGATVREVFENAFGARPDLRSYLVDDQGALRKHMAVFVDGAQVADRSALSDPVGPRSRIQVLQALSGG